jgi:hypothetical protein
LPNHFRYWRQSLAALLNTRLFRMLAVGLIGSCVRDWGKRPPLAYLPE